MNIPILVLFFNREYNVLSLIKSLSDLKPKKIYLSCDGARNSEEVKLIEGIRVKVIQEITWDCDIYTNFSEHNLGCKLAVSSGVQWFFRQVKEGIVLEDDCIPSLSFFNYVALCLDTYRDNKKIATIGGRRELDSFNINQVIFSSKFFCWGWASWSDRILPIDVEFGYQPILPESVVSELDFWELRHVKGIHNLMLDGIVNSWAYSYDLAFREHKQLHIVPPINYIHNIGIGQGTHNTNIRIDSVQFEDQPFDSVLPVIINKNRDYITQYLKKTYGFIKILFFPYASKIKIIQKIWKRS